MTHKPFKDLSDAEKGALLLAHHEGKRIDRLFADWDCTSMWEHGVSSISDDGIYRIAPEPKTPDTINWEHVSDEFNFLARDDDGEPWVFMGRPHPNTNEWYGGGNCSSANALASYRRGTCDWQDSLVIRPGYEGK